jgi:hypothetical protein
MFPGTVLRGPLATAIVMVLVATRDDVALKKTSRLVELAAVVAVGEIVTLVTAPVCEPIR